MREFLERPAVVWFSRLVLALVFLVYGASKIPHLATFAASVHNYRILPGAYENIVAVILPWVEVAGAVALLRKAWLPGGALVIGALTTIFLLAISSAIVRGLDINCGCFTLSDASPTYNNLWRHIVFDLVLLALAVHLLWATARAGPAD